MAFVSTPRHLKDVAKDLQAALRKKHISKTIKDCVTLVEAMFAATNDVDMSSLSQFDDEIDALAVGKRIRVQANVLLSNGVPDGMSESIVNRIRPTKNRTKPPLTRLDAELSEKTLRLLDLAYEIGAEDVAEDIGKILFETDISEIYDQMIALLERFRSTSPRALHHMAIATAVSRRKTSMALDMLAEQLRQFPDDPQRHWVLVFSGDVRNGTYGGGKDVKAALNDYEAAAALGNKYAAFSAAQLYEDGYEEGDRERAIAMYERASALGSTEAKTNKAILLASTGFASTQEKTEVVSLIQTAAREGDEKAKNILVKATVDEMIRAGQKPLLDTQQAATVPKVGDTRFYPDEASALAAVERLSRAWNSKELPRREDAWFQDAVAVATEYKDWNALISAVCQGKTAGRADECLNRGQLIKRRESQVDRMRAFMDIDWGVAQSIHDKAEPTRIKLGPLVLGEDYNLVYDLQPISIDGSRSLRDLDSETITRAELPGTLGEGKSLRYSIDEDGDHIFEIEADGNVVASVVFYRSGYVDLSLQEGLRLDPVAVPQAISAITIVALDLPDLEPDRDKALVHLGEALAILSWHDILWMTAEGHPPVEKLSAELRGYSEDEGVEELCGSVMSSHGMKLLKNRSDEFGRSVERRMAFSGIDFYDWSAGTIFQQGNPADPDWWDPDGGKPSLSDTARSPTGDGSELYGVEGHYSEKIAQIKVNADEVKLLTVGFDRLDSELVEMIATTISAAFGLQANPHRVFEDRATYKFDKIEKVTISQLVEAMRKVRATPPVNFVDMHVIRGDSYWTFECDDHGTVTMHRADDEDDESCRDNVYRTWLDSVSGDWGSLSEGDMTCFAAVTEEDVPAKMYLRHVSSPVDPDFSSLMKRWGSPFKPGHKNAARERSTSTFLEENALVAHKMSGKMVVGGVYFISHKTDVAQRKHELLIRYIVCDHEDAVVGAVASICMGIEDIRRGWEELFDIGARITVSVRLDGLQEETEDLLIQSLAMRDGAWRHCEEDDMFPTVLKVYVKGKLVDHKSYD